MNLHGDTSSLTGKLGLKKYSDKIHTDRYSPFLNVPRVFIGSLLSSSGSALEIRNLPSLKRIAALAAGSLVSNALYFGNVYNCWAVSRSTYDLKTNPERSKLREQVGPHLSFIARRLGENKITQNLISSTEASLKADESSASAPMPVSAAIPVANKAPASMPAAVASETMSWIQRINSITLDLGSAARQYVQDTKETVNTSLIESSVELKGALSQTVNRGIGETVLTEANNKSLLDVELTLLRWTDHVQEILKATSPQQIMESAHVVVDYIKKYRETFALLSQQTFSSALEETLAWKNQMGDLWHSALVPTSGIETGQIWHQSALTAFTDEAVDRLDNILGIEDNLALIVNPFPVVVGAAKLYIRPKLDAVVKEKVTNIDISSKLYQGIQILSASLSQFAVSKNLMPSLAVSPALAHPHQFYVETVGFKKVVSGLSPAAVALGITIGMDAQAAKIRWNSHRRPAASAVVYSKAEMINNPHPSQVLLKNSLEAIFNAPYHYRDVALAAISTSCRFGKVLELFCKVIFKGIDLSLNGAGHVLGFPTSKALAEEISKNLLAHAYNPTLNSFFLILFDRLVGNLEQKGTSAALGSAASNRSAFMGELLLELPLIMTLICPSLFNPRYPKALSLLARAAFWSLRIVSGLTALTLSNPVAQAVYQYVIKKWVPANKKELAKMMADKTVLQWVKQSGFTLLGFKSNLEATASILGSAYKALGDSGFVSSSQDHFKEAGLSYAHLLHHTLLAAGRVASSHSKEMFEFVQKMNRVKNKEALSHADLNILPLQHKEKAEKFNSYRNALDEVMPMLSKVEGWISSPSELSENLMEFLSLNAQVFDHLSELAISSPTAEARLKAFVQNQVKIMELAERAQGFSEENNASNHLWRDLYSEVLNAASIQDRLVEDLKFIYSKVYHQALDEHARLCSLNAEDLFKEMFIQKSHETFIDQLAKTVRSPEHEQKVRDLDGAIALKNNAKKDKEAELEAGMGYEFNKDLAAREKDFFDRNRVAIEALGQKASLIKQGLEYFAGWSEVINNQAKKIDFFMPEIFEAHRLAVASIEADKMILELEQARLFKIENKNLREIAKGKIIPDPVAVLEQSGLELGQMILQHFAPEIVDAAQAAIDQR